MKLVYRHCWEYASRCSPLPSFESIYYLVENAKFAEYEYLKHLMDDFGLIVIHKKYIDDGWKHIHLGLYIDHYLEIIENLFDRDNEQQLRIVTMFDAKWMLKILQNVDRAHSRDFIQEKSGNFHVFVDEILQPLIGYLYQNDCFDDLRMLLFELKRIHALDLLNSNNFLSFGLNRSWTDRYKQLLGVLYGTIVHGDDAINDQRGAVIALSIGLWIEEDGKHRNNSMETIKGLAHKSVFYPFLIEDVVQMLSTFDLVPDTSNYLMHTVCALYHERQDWSTRKGVYGDNETTDSLDSCSHHL